MDGNYDKRASIGVGVFLLRDGHVLLGKRKGSHGADLWAPPGGKPDAGEHPYDAAKREFFEETAIDPTKLDVLPHWDYAQFDADGQPHSRWDESDPHLHYVTLYFYGNARPADNALVTEPDKCSEWQWVNLKSIYSGSRVLTGGNGYDEYYPGVQAAACVLYKLLND